MSTLSKARAAYSRKRHNRDTLRTYLRAKARVGRFDSRMFDYYGVPHIENAACRRAVVRAYAHGLVPTATTNGVHAATSLHYQRDAVDFGLVPSEIGTRKGARRMRTFQSKEYNRRVAGKLPAMVELIGPTNNLIVLRGQRTSLAEGTALENQHDNHVHEGYRG